MTNRDIDIARMIRFIRQGCLFEYLGSLDNRKRYRVRNIPRMATTVFIVAMDNQSSVR